MIIGHSKFIQWTNTNFLWIPYDYDDEICNSYKHINFKKIPLYEPYNGETHRGRLQFYDFLFLFYLYTWALHISLQLNFFIANLKRLWKKVL